MHRRLIALTLFCLVALLGGCASGGGRPNAGTGAPRDAAFDGDRLDASGGGVDAPGHDASVPGDAPSALDASRDTGGPRDAPGVADAPRDAPAATPDAPDGGSARCGDGFVDAPEICDDGNTSSGDGCRSDCRSVECGGADRYEDPVTHHCYWRSTSVVSRSSAISTCGSEGGYLIRWADRAERDAAYTATLAPRGGRVWIGLQRLGSTWTWDDGTASATAATDFRSGEPSGDGTCAEWGPANSLNDIPCSERRDMVCERDPAGTPR